MHIEIRIPFPRPAYMIFVIGLIMGVFIATGWEKETPTVDAVDAVGGQTETQANVEAEQDMDRERIKQAVLSRREEILRYNIQKLEEEAKQFGGEAEETLSENRKVLLAILKEKRASEELLKKSLEQIWESQGIAYTGQTGDIGMKLSWPAKPTLGISATFEDTDYIKRFGVAHHAVDIPVEQGTVIKAPAAGTVSVVKDNGLGYSYVTIDHGNGLETVYGHVSGFIAKVGDKVDRGDPVAYSGGRPGSPGAGLMTTGSHLHFAVRYKGQLVDPLKYLETWPGLTKFGEQHTH